MTGGGGYSSLIRGNDDSAELSEPVAEALSKFGHFENLKKVSLCFSGECSIDDPDDSFFDESPESVAFRTEVLSLAINALDDDSHPTPKFRALSIKGLQDYNDPRLTSSPAFQAVIARLETLEVFIVTQVIFASPEDSLYLPELHVFYKALPGLWLSPAMDNLTKLTLFSDIYFGYIPKLDLRQLHFPKLQELVFGNYAFTHDWQFEWILQHSRTLHTLIMDDCPIIYHFRTDGDLDNERYPVDPLGYDGDNTEFTYERRWCWFFRAIKSSLHRLHHFQFGAAEWDSDGSGFDLVDELIPRLYKGMYMTFNAGCGPSPWNEYRGSHGGGFEVERPDYEEDREAFEDIQKALQLRRGYLAAYDTALFEEY